ADSHSSAHHRARPSSLVPPALEFVYGRRPVLEALRAQGRSIHKLWIAEGTHGTEEILRLARERGVPVQRARREQLDARVQGHHQGVIAQATVAALMDLGDYLAKRAPPAHAL